MLFTEQIGRAVSFYTAIGFEQVFRVPADGEPIHVDLVLDGYRIGLATARATREDHQLSPVTSGQRAAIILWTNDVTAAFDRLTSVGAVPVHRPQPWLGRLLIAWLTDPDGHLIQIVQEDGTQGTGRSRPG